MATYENYKDSGVKWLGQIPSHWDMRPNISFLIEQKSRVDQRKDLDLLSLTLKGVIFRDKESGEGKMPESFEAYKIVNPNEIIFCLFDMDETPRTVGVSNQKGMITGAYDIFHVAKDVNVKFLFYYYLSVDNAKALRPYYSGLRKVVKIGTFKHIQTPIPPANEQKAIVAYLDKVTGEIDRAIEAQQKMIEALNERKQIIITRAVTHGLNPDAPLRDSGIDWLGKIPAHWEITTLRRLFKIRAGGDAKLNLYSDTQDKTHPYPVFTNAKDASSVYGYTSKAIFPKNSITVTGRGDIGKAFYRNVPFDAIIRLLVLTPYSLNNCEFFAHYINSVLVFKSDSAAVSQLSAVQIAPSTIVLPPEREQTEIVNYIHKQRRPINIAIEDCERMISLLQERKQIIINEVVTGKKKVI